ncbi:hypothetical protein ACFQZ4_18460 [Catellatospora coxensis]
MDAPAYLMTMPLHAITEVLGEQGLRDRFALEIQRLPAADQAVLAEALELAGRLHAEQRRVREPYLNHLLRVTIRIITYYRITDRDVLVAALLHDSVEDQPWGIVGQAHRSGPPPREQALAVLAGRFGPASRSWSTRSPTRSTTSTATRTSSTASTSSSRWTSTRGPGSSRSPTSPTTASASSTPSARRCCAPPPSTSPWSRCCASWWPGRTRRFSARSRRTSSPSSTSPRSASVRFWPGVEDQKSSSRLTVPGTATW